MSTRSSAPGHRPPSVLLLDAGPLRTPGGAVPCRVAVLRDGPSVVVIDAGISRRDRTRRGGLGPAGLLLRPAPDPEDTLVAGLRRHGIDPAEVGDVVLTHADPDHLSGIADLPGARVHLARAELEAWRERRGPRGRLRYRPSPPGPPPRWVPHGPRTVGWEGFPGCVPLDAVLPGMLLVPLPGHTTGHCGVLTPTSEGMLFHVGDAAHSAGVLRAGETPATIRFRQALLAEDRELLASTRRRLEALARRRPELVLVTSHGREDAKGVLGAAA